MNKYVDYLNYRNFQKKSEDIGNILRPLGAPRVQPAEAPVNYRDPVVPQPTPRPVAPQPAATPYRPPVATHYRPPAATQLPSRDPLNRNMSEAQRFANGFNGVKSSGLMDKIPAGVMTNDDFADKEMMDYNKGLPSATSPTYAPNVPWEKMPNSPSVAAPFDRAGIATQTQKPHIQAGMSPQPANPLNFPVKPGFPTAMTNDDFADKEMMDYNKGLPSATSPTYAPNVPWERQPRSTGGHDLIQSYPANGAEWSKGLPNTPTVLPTPTPNPTFPVRPAAPVLPKPLGAKIGMRSLVDEQDEIQIMRNKIPGYSYPSAPLPTPTPTPTPMPAAPVLPKPLGIKSSQEQLNVGQIVGLGAPREDAQHISNKFKAISDEIRAMQNKVPAPLPTPTPMPAAPVLPKPLGAKVGQERQSKLNRYIKALELLNS